MNELIQIDHATCGSVINLFLNQNIVVYIVIIQKGCPYACLSVPLYRPKSRAYFVGRGSTNITNPGKALENYE